jgi:hypothetical protein
LHPLQPDRLYQQNHCGIYRLDRPERRWTRIGKAMPKKIGDIVDAETFKDDAAGRCEIDDGPSVSAETSRRLACDASVVRLLEDERGEPLNIGRKTRTIPTGLRRALNARDRGCRFPGCTHKRFVEGHHIEHWAKGGETKLSNLVNLCDFHHRKVHEGSVRVEILDDGALRFTYPNGQAIDSAASLHGDWKQLPILNAQGGIRIDAKTAATRWRGEKMDYDTGIGTLLRRRARGERVSAETSGNSAKAASSAGSSPIQNL